MTTIAGIKRSWLELGMRRGNTGWAAEKAAREVRIFREFAELSGLPIDTETIESRPSPEPDIRCVVAGEGQ
jgi:hypothetical protein